MAQHPSPKARGTYTFLTTFFTASTIWPRRPEKSRQPEDQASLPEERPLRRQDSMNYVPLLSADDLPTEYEHLVITHMKGLQDKIALVTGGSRGLGRNIALALAGNGADIILTYRQQKAEGEAVVAEIEQLGRKAALLRLDVADLRQLDEFLGSVRQALEQGFSSR